MPSVVVRDPLKPPLVYDGVDHSFQERHALLAQVEVLVSDNMEEQPCYLQHVVGEVGTFTPRPPEENVGELMKEAVKGYQGMTAAGLRLQDGDDCSGARGFHIGRGREHKPVVHWGVGEVMLQDPPSCLPSTTASARRRLPPTRGKEWAPRSLTRS